MQNSNILLTIQAYIGQGYIRGGASDYYSIDTSASTSTNPSYAFRGDEDTGIGRATEDSLALIAGGINIVNVTNVSATAGHVSVNGTINATGEICSGDVCLTTLNTTVIEINGSLGDYVPYTGATQNVDLGANNFTVDTNTLFVDSNTDKVGIGTNSPGDFLTITPSSSGGITIDGNSNTYFNLDRPATTSRGEMIFKTAAATKWVVGLPDSDLAGDGSEFFIGETSGGTTPAFWIESGGNVGINTTAPDDLLTLSQKADDDGFKIYGYDDKASDWGKAYIDSNGYFNLDASSRYQMRESGALILQIYDSFLQVYSSGSLTRYLSFGSTNQYQMYNDVAGDKAWRFQDSSANEFMQINDTGSVADFEFNDGQIFLNGTTGKVGIGMDSPTTMLYVNGTAYTDTGLLTLDTPSGFGSLLIKESGVDRAIIGFGNNGNIFSGALTDSMALRSENAMHLGSSSTIAMTIDTSNRVGIGTETPSSTLEVNGTFNATQNGGSLVVDSDGDIMIGI